MASPREDNIMLWNAVIIGYALHRVPSVVFAVVPITVSSIMRICIHCQVCLCCSFDSVHSPPDTPFADGTFKLLLEFSEEYPNKAPKVKFLSKMFHPNGELAFRLGFMTWRCSITFRLLVLQCMPTDPFA
jgi:hypothetical protein